MLSKNKTILSKPPEVSGKLLSYWANIISAPLPAGAPLGGAAFAGGAFLSSFLGSLGFKPALAPAPSYPSSFWGFM